MGLLDGLLQSAGGLLGGQQGEGGNALAGISELIQQQGGLGGLVEKFQQGGLSDVVGSWIGTGDNAPISAEQIQQVLGSEQVSALAARFGVDPQQASDLVAQYLPQVVDTLTPNGEVDAGSGDLLSQGLGALSGLFKR